MTYSTYPTVPQDFPIQAAENEGMPPRMKSDSALPPIARVRWLAGTLTMGPSMTYPETDGLWFGKKTPIKPAGKPKRHPIARVFSRLAVVAGLIASFAFPAFAQDAPAPMPAHAQPKSYGAGWECLHGVQNVDDATCLKIVVPDGQYLDPSGKRWNCLRGYMQVHAHINISLIQEFEPAEPRQFQRKTRKG